MDSLKETKSKVHKKIDEATSDPELKKQLKEQRDNMSALKKKKNDLIEEKKKMRARLDEAKNQTDKISKEKKDARSNVKYTDLAEIDKAIKELQRKQETTSMSLSEEKKLIKEIDALKNSKKFIADIENKSAAIGDIQAQKKVIAEQIKAKDKEIDGLSEEIKKVVDVIDSLRGKENAKKDTMSELFKERDDLKKKMDETAAKRNEVRAAYREQNNKWFNYQRALKAKKRIEWEAEKARKDAIQAEWEAQRAAEEAKKIPYEEEQNLCEYLAHFLEITYLDKNSQEKSEKKSDVVAVKDDPFAGLVPAGKKGNDEEEYFGKGKGKKKRVRAQKKQDAPGPFTLSVDMFDQFSLISLTPPTKLEEVEDSVKALREKKEWYKQQPRGSVPTAQDIRKSNEKAAAKLRQETAAATEGQTKKSKAPGNFSLKNDDFVPLGVGAASAAVNSSWGQKPAAAQETS